MTDPFQWHSVEELIDQPIAAKDQFAELAKCYANALPHRQLTTKEAMAIFMTSDEVMNLSAPSKWWEFWK